ncbi:hypothetical protein [Novipirellula galeiformis]|nr:hypothetical protein [Novipirellula galeiformis]
MRSDSEQAREIAKEIAIKMIDKAGIRVHEDAETVKKIRQRAVEMARDITEAFPRGNC